MLNLAVIVTGVGGITRNHLDLPRVFALMEAYGERELDITFFFRMRHAFF
jgi:hypothetical protein